MFYYRVRVPEKMNWAQRICCNMLLLANINWKPKFDHLNYILLWTFWFRRNKCKNIFKNVFHNRTYIEPYLQHGHWFLSDNVMKLQYLDVIFWNKSLCVRVAVAGSVNGRDKLLRGNISIFHHGCWRRI